MIEVGTSGRDLGETMALSGAVCPVAMCLANVLAEADAHCAGSGLHLRSALGHLGLVIQLDVPARGDGVSSASVLAAYLEYLLPDVLPRSEAAALSLQRAIHTLRKHEEAAKALQ